MRDTPFLFCTLIITPDLFLIFNVLLKFCKFALFLQQFFAEPQDFLAVSVLSLFQKNLYAGYAAPSTTAPTAATSAPQANISHSKIMLSPNPKISVPDTPSEIPQIFAVFFTRASRARSFVRSSLSPPLRTDGGSLYLPPFLRRRRAVGI